LSPHSRHGRGSAGRRTRHRPGAGRHAEGLAPQPPSATPSEGNAEQFSAEAPARAAESEARAGEPQARASESQAPAAEERRARPKKRKHGTLYRWLAAYLPLLAILFGLLGAIWVWTVVNPPPPTPAQRWEQIEAKWTPPREKARQDLAGHGPDFAAQLADYRAFYDATKGWMDDVRAYDWSTADPYNQVKSAVDRFLSDGDTYLALLKNAYEAKTPYEILTMEESLPAADQTWETDRALVRVALGLPAVPKASELPLPSANCIPVESGSPGASASASPEGSASPLASGSPGASVSPELTLPPCPMPTASESASESASASPSLGATTSASPAASPSPAPSPSPSAG
jgi:hypothetical protein